MRFGRHGRLAYAGAAALSLMGCRKESFEYRPEADQSAEPRYLPPLPPPIVDLPQSPQKGGPPKVGTAASAAPSANADEQALITKTDPGCLEGMARIGSFCMDRFEISLVDSRGGRFRRNIHPPESMGGLKAVSLPLMNPQGHLSQEQAAKACQGAGKRLCTSDEWESACRGPNSTAFPYGPAAAPGICNVDKRDPHILDSHFPDIPHLQRSGNEFNDPLLLLDPAYQTKAGQMAGCVTLTGVYDLDGNMSEWVSDTIEKEGKVFGTFRGAPFSGHLNEGCARKTTAHDSKYYDYSTGTRCCADAGRKQPL